MELTLKFKLLVIGIVVFITTFAIAVYINTFLVGSRAAGTSVPITIVEKTGSIAGTKEIFATFKVPGKISTFSFRFKTTGSIKVQSTKEPVIVGTATPPAGFFTEHTKTTEEIAYTISKPDAELPAALTIPITVACSTTGVGTFTIDPATSEVAGLGGPYTFDPIETGSYTCTSVATGGGGTSVPVGPRAHFSPDSAKIPVGEQSSTTLLIDGLAAGQKISSFDVKMQVAEGVDLIGFTTAPAPTVAPTVAPIADSGCKTIAKTWDSNTRVAQVSQLCTGATLLDSVSVPITVKGTKNATGKIAITSIEVVGPQALNGYTLGKEAFNFQVGAGGTSDGGTGGSSTSMQIQLSLRLQGIQAKPRNAGPIQFRVGVSSKSMAQPITQNAAFTPDDRGIYHGSVGFNVPAGDGYILFVKGPMHLQKKVCDIKPSEATPGTYSCDKGLISLKNGDNTFDFSGVYMMSCDFGAQDGICNSGDMALIFNNLGTTDAAIIQSADINRDGALNTTDHALAIASLSIKVDDR